MRLRKGSCLQQKQKKEKETLSAVHPCDVRKYDRKYSTIPNQKYFCPLHSFIIGLVLASTTTAYRSKWPKGGENPEAFKSVSPSFSLSHVGFARKLFLWGRKKR